MSNTIRTPIVDRNGKRTTVYKNAGTDVPESRELPQSPVLSAGNRPAIAMNADYVRIPDGIPPESANIAYNFIGERLTANTDDPLYARADYAEVTEEGVVYGINLNDDYLGEVFAGKKIDGESDAAYNQRKLDGVRDNWSGITEMFKDVYGADLGEGNGEDYSTVEFYVDYEDGNPRMSSLEWMGDRVESETKLLDLNNDYSYGTKLQSEVAKKFGYHFELTDTPDRQVGDGFWVKDEA